MSTQMLNALTNATNVAYTENGARAFLSTKSYLVDLFAQGGALRNRSESEIVQLFSKALAEDKLLAMKMLFYFRDVRGGQGERETFRKLIRYLAFNHPTLIALNAWAIPTFGRWDDLYALFDTPVEEVAHRLIHDRFYYDLGEENPSLLAKWLKSENASSYQTKKLARKTREILGLSPRQYRKALSDLRNRINIVEAKMSAKDWDAINYSQVPSQAGLKYRNAFLRNDNERYSAFIGKVKEGKASIKTATLYPYEIIREIPASLSYANSKYSMNYGNAYNTDVLDVMWNNLPDYLNGNTDNILTVVDTSGSMRGLPLEVALSIGIYTAERNHGVFHNHFITFANRPQLQKVVGNNIVEKVQNMARAHWDTSTNIKGVFQLILDTAIANGLSQDDMPSRVFIVSDMEFNAGVSDSRALFDEIRAVYVANGYDLPELVFWNVNARTGQFPVTISHNGVQLVSGCSPSIFKNLLAGKGMSAYDLMLQTLSNEKYDVIRIV